MKRPRHSLATVAVLVLIARGAVGCSTTYDGSASFYEQHPEYRNEPSYMHPSDSGDDNSDAHPARPW